MKKFLSPAYPSAAAHDLAMLILRIGLGCIIVIGHGWMKIDNFTEMQAQFVNFLSMGPHFSLVLSIFAEFVCGILIIVGLFTRLAVIPLIINMLTAITLVHHWQIMAQAQLPFVLLVGFLAILLLGPGKVSLDGLIFKKTTD